MYKKVLITDSFEKPNKRDFKWLISKRLKVSFSADSFLLKNNLIKFSEIESVVVYEYKSFFIFNSYIFCFKHLEKYYQIGINNKDRELITQKINTKESKIKTSFWDIFYFALILILIYLGYKV